MKTTEPVVQSDTKHAIVAADSATRPLPLADLLKQLNSRRETLILATKGGLRIEGGKLLRDASARWLRQGVEQSLRNLGADYIDLYQVHWPDLRTSFQETADALERLVQAG